ncbi:thialysine N-epsilon-acetyltransferase-like [Diadema setosum]|uniref:thialysine N-epsilon-acetyltransferase-like n=1 Tax=Diadema setosum TaxID=31175 RepID=UPI003B3BBF69
MLCRQISRQVSSILQGFSHSWTPILLGTTQHQPLHQYHKPAAGEQLLRRQKMKRLIMTSNNPQEEKPWDPQISASSSLTSGEFSVFDPEDATKINLRPCCSTDCATLLKYIRASAELEGYLEHVTITEEELIEDGFGEHPFYKCAIAEAFSGKDDESCIVGYAVYCYAFCLWKGRSLIWEDMFVHPHYRALGIGSMLLHEVTKIAYNHGCHQVSGYVDASNASLQTWYERLGFQNFTKDFGYHMYSGSGPRLEKFIKNSNPQSKCVSRGLKVESSL